MSSRACRTCGGRATPSAWWPTVASAVSPVRPRLPPVIVQRMAAPDAAGVAFSVDPVNGRRSVAVVAAVPGLGDALVSGDADADAYEVTRTRQRPR